ncbi:FadR/GntR family transcriptional regulator [Flavilitoribacter nigricans]|uniref:GntR family transcriptional regulator n=1 Tax=Flavilitoribacter nigricans (strain ATCC 23147 / DSM 23189 / NBRC 102662 / NCIMB 1420 / SS-2) TaxID=1122177 RepID=A0A2D0NCL3_FLAN2|nr:GntR family transcriptional regulator [Flavilitoribacter nigricans]PHN05919.1 GntR family transcriptional regulator [Flavilitoribacter nigricans DSM 23189 = NBRC 102662]
MTSKDLRITDESTTLVDRVEEKLLDYFRENKLMPGDSLPNEVELAKALGVARTVLREALSRLKMMGLVKSRTKVGMTLAEPDILGGMKRVMDPRIMSKNHLLDILNLRVIIEIGMSPFVFMNKTEKDIEELEQIVDRERVLRDNQLSVEEESKFHFKLYEMTGNDTIIQLNQIFAPVFGYIKDHFSKILDDYTKTTPDQQRPSHKDLVNILKDGTADQFQKAMRKHLELYFHLLHKEYQKGDG